MRRRNPQAIRTPARGSIVIITTTPDDITAGTADITPAGSRVEALFALADAIDGRIRAATVLAERLPQAIVAGALRGELVPTEAELAAEEGRDYEPASVLLERIQESRKQNKPAKRGRRGKAQVSVSHIADGLTNALSLRDKGA